MADDAPEQSRALDMFIAGATGRQIADRLKMTDVEVDEAITDGLAEATRRRAALSGDRSAVYVERAEALFRAHYLKALAGDHRSAQICLGILTSPAADGSPAQVGASLGEEGGEVKALEVLRDRLAREIDACKSPRLLAALSRQFVTVIDQLAERKPPASTSKRDELARKRDARRRAAGGGSDAADPGSTGSAD